MDALVSPADELFFGGSAGGGKLLSVNAVVWTPFGPKRHGELAVGDQVCNPDGSIARVITVSHYRNVPLYRVTCIDGASVLAGANHNWLVKIASVRFKAQRRMFNNESNSFDDPIIRARVMTTAQLKKCVDRAYEAQRQGKRPYWPLLPLTQPVIMTVSHRYPDGVWPIDPYVLGVILGDGHIVKKVSLTTSDLSISDAFTREMYRLGARVVRDDREGNAAWQLRVNGATGVVRALQKLDLQGCRSESKFVPESYKRASVDMRWAMLQGLMDTDGTADFRGHCSFCSVSNKLALDVQWLARSLGFKATLFEKEPFYLGDDGRRIHCQLAYQVYIQGKDTARLFRLERKSSRCRPYNGGFSQPMRRVVGVGLEDEGNAVCIGVDHPNGLYLTDDFIVTHNTDLLLGTAMLAHKKSIIFRREYAQLTGADSIVERSRELLSGAARFNGQTNIWRDIPGDRMLEFGAVQREDDKNKYKGKSHDLKAFDELPEFTESQYRFLIGWARTTSPNQRVRVVAAGNPPTRPEGEWVKRYWGPWLDSQHPHPARPGELRWFAMIDGADVEVENGEPFEHKGETIKPKSRSFIPARLGDNPYLANTDYATVLQNLPEPLRSQLLYGDFEIGTVDDPWQVIPTEWVRLAFERWKQRKEPDVPLTAIGADIARGGKDQMIISERYDNWFAPLKKYPGKSVLDGPAAAALVVKIPGSAGACINVDVIGIGSSAYDSLASQNSNVVALNFSEATTARDRSGRLKMRNVRAEAYWGMREALDPELGDDLALAPDNELLADLTAPRWKLTTSGILIEEKKAIAERLGRSPDCGDAVVMARMGQRGMFFG